MNYNKVDVSVKYNTVNIRKCLHTKNAVKVCTYKMTITYFLWKINTVDKVHEGQLESQRRIPKLSRVLYIGDGYNIV